MSGILKFRNERRAADGRRLYWHRVMEDGAPLRAASPPNLRKEEIESRLRQIADFDCQTFDMTKPEDRKQYRKTMDKIANRAWTLVFIDRNMKTKQFYVEWLEHYMEDIRPDLS
jgi:hypothetical protein